MCAELKGQLGDGSRVTAISWSRLRSIKCPLRSSCDYIKESCNHQQTNERILPATTTTSCDQCSKTTNRLPANSTNRMQECYLKNHRPQYGGTARKCNSPSQRITKPRLKLTPNSLPLNSLFLILICCNQMNLSSQQNYTNTDKSDQQQQQKQQPPLTTSVSNTSQQQQQLAANTSIASMQRAPFLKQAPLHLRLGNQQREHLSYKTTYACEGNRMDLNCQEGKLIHLVRANYGRFSLSICNEHGHSNYSVQCASFRAFLFMETRCNKLNNCSVTVSEELFGDPCEGTAKYLEVQYYCYDVNSDPNQVGKSAAHSTIATTATTTTTTTTATSTSQQQAVISNPNGADLKAAAPWPGHKSQATTSSGGQPTVVVAQQPPASVGVFQSDSGHDNEQQQHQQAAADLSGQLGRFQDSAQQQQTVISQQQQQPAATYCAPQFGARNLFWNATRAGSLASQPCPDGALGRAQWLCDAERLRFVPAHSAHFGRCRSAWLARLGQQLDQLLETPGELARQRTELTIRSIMNELNLMARTKELFSEDLKQLDIMIGQMLAQMRSLSSVWFDTTTSSTNNAWISVPTIRSHQQHPLAGLYEEFLNKLVSISSQLFDWSQRQAWLELPNSTTRRTIELRLIGHLRDAAHLWADSVSAEHLLERAPIRQPNLIASVVVLQQVLLDAAAASPNDELSLFPGAQAPRYRPQMYAQQQRQQQFELFDGGADSAPSELRATQSLMRELSALGVSKLLVFDIKKPDFGQLARQQVALAEQQQQLALAQQAANGGVQPTNELGAGAWSQQAVEPAPTASQQQQQQQQNEQFQSRLFGVFALIGSDSASSSVSSAELLLGADSDLQQRPVQQQHAIGDKLLEARRLAAGLLEQWPISVEFRLADGNQMRPGACQSLVNEGDEQQRPACHTSRFNSTSVVCSCTRLGFVWLQRADLQWPEIGATLGETTLVGWPEGGEPSSRGLESLQQAPPTFLTTATTRARSTTAGSLVGALIVIGVGLLMLSAGALFVRLAGRLWAGHAARHASRLKQKAFFDSFGSGAADSSGGLTTAPLAVDHQQQRGLALAGSHAGAQPSSSIIGLNNAQLGLKQAQQAIYAPHSVGFASSASSSSHSPAALEAYAPMVASTHYNHAPLHHSAQHHHQQQHHNHRLRPGRSLSELAHWLASRPARWLSGALARPAHAAGLKSAQLDGQTGQRRVILGANGVSSLVHETQPAPTLCRSHFNGYTQTLGLQQPNSRQQQQQSSSNSSYVSSSAYYEEIGVAGQQSQSQQKQQSALHTSADPFRRQQQQQLPQTTGIAYSMELPQQLQQPSYAPSIQALSSGNSNSQQHDLVATTPRHYLFASPSAVSAYKQQQQHIRGHQH